TLDMSEVTGLVPSADGLALTAGEKTVLARTVIIAAGSSLRRLGIPGEEAYEGRGVSHCGSCDGPPYSEPAGAVVRGGDSAVDEAITVRQYASRVILFHRGPALRSQRALSERLASDEKVDVRLDTTVSEVLGNEDGVTGVRVQARGSAPTDVEAAALF